MAKAKLVMAKSLSELLSGPRQIEVLGRALVVLFNKQTETEKQVNATNVNNSVGFTGADGKSGVLTAKYYLKHGTLLPWMVEKWMRPNKKGQARIVKYHGQLNKAAQTRAAAANG